MLDTRPYNFYSTRVVCHREAHRAVMTMYCLEILRYIKDEEDVRARGGIFEHVGYEHRVDPSTGHRQILRFRTKKKAAQHYDENIGKDGLRPLNAHNTWKSDWHPVTCLAHAVRVDDGFWQPATKVDGMTLDT